MRLLRLFFWGWVVLALLVAIAIGALRIAWEFQMRRIELAVDLRDAQKLAADASLPLETLLDALRAAGATALIVDPTVIEELRTAWPTLTRTDSFYPAVLLAWSALDRLKRAGWALIWKVPPPESFSQADFSVYLGKISALEPQAYLPLDWGPEPLQAPDALRELRASLDQTLAALVLLEFHDYTPAAALYRQGFARFIRAHTISLAERETLGPQARLARFERAAIERNVRLLYLHLPQGTVEEAIAEVRALRERLQQDGFQLSALPTSPPPGIAWPLIALLFAGIAALVALTVDALWPLPGAVFLNSWLMLLGLMLLGFVQDAPLIRQLGALLAATVSPISAFITLGALEKRQVLRGTGGRCGLIWVGGLAFGTWLGGLLSAAILSDLPFFEGLYLFQGVKVALTLPILCILALYTMRQPDQPWWRSLRRRPLRRHELILGVSVMGALLFVLLRSGNGAFLPVSGLEDQARNLLESLFYARPRFKEFLIGHPLLFLWAAWGAPRFRARSWPLLALGLLGPVSIVNTYEHLHTPLLLSLARTGIGLALGLVLGWVLWRAVHWLEARWIRTK